MTKRKPTPEDITKANQSISRPENPDTERKKRASRRLGVAIPPAAVGAELLAEGHEDGETEAALRRATDTKKRDRAKDR